MSNTATSQKNLVIINFKNGKRTEIKVTPEQVQSTIIQAKKIRGYHSHAVVPAE